MKPDLSKPWCYYVAADQDQKELNGFVPSIVVEGEQGHYPMKGKIGQLPWVWGPSLREAYVQADRANRRMGKSEEEVDRIVVSSMRVTK
tara:strand:+ start:350 stop:616 length:267 start_codon:yes stop_codon:yes gene_type:complete